MSSRRNGSRRSTPRRPPPGPPKKVGHCSQELGLRSGDWNDMAQPHQTVPTAPTRTSRTTFISRRRRAASVRSGRAVVTAGLQRGRAKFLRYFPKGFRDPLYEDWERGYKWAAHQRWIETLGKASFRKLLAQGKHREIAAHAVAIEARTNLLFSFEKMALRDAVKPPAGARAFAEGLYDFLHGPGGMERRFTAWCAVVARLPRRQTRVLTWPVVTVFGFIAEPATNIFLKPNVTKRAAQALGLPFEYQSRPGWEPYGELLRLARAVRKNLRALHPRDMIDLQSFLWVQGSDEYPNRR